MSRLMTFRRLRAIVASLLLGAATSAFALNTATIVSSALSPDCLEYRVVGICYWLYGTPFGCSVRTSVKVRHYVPGFYDTYRAKTPCTAWPYDATRDAGLAQVDSGGGYPSCRQWWADGGQGLRSRLLAQVAPDLLTRIGRWVGFLSQSEVNDSVIRAVVSPRQQKMNQGAVYTDYGGQIDKTLPNVVTRGASDLGLTVGSLGFFPAMDVVRQALPMVLTMLKMALVICIPLVLLIGTYDLKTVVTVSCVQFALFFVDFWFQLAR